MTEEDMYKASLANCENIKQTCERLFDDYNELCEYNNAYKNYNVVHILRLVGIRMPKLRKFYKSINKFMVNKDKYSVVEFIDKSLYYAITFKEEYYKVIYAMMVFCDVKDNVDEIKIIAGLHENPSTLFMNESFKNEVINNYGYLEG